MPEAPVQVKGLPQFRHKIDACDSALLGALQRRMRIKYVGDTSQTADQNRAELRGIILRRCDTVMEIGRYKKEHDLPPLDPERRKQHERDLVMQGERLGLPEPVVVEVYHKMHDLALKLEA